MSDPTSKDRIRVVLGDFFVHESAVKEYLGGNLRKAPDDALRGRVEEIIAALDLGDWTVLVDELAPDLAEAWAAGVEGAMPLVGFTSDETINEARALFGLGEVAGGDVAPSIVNLVNERSVEWAEQHAADLVTQIEENTRDMLRATIVEAIEEGWGAEQLGDEIADSAGFSDYRAEMIGRTEVIAANNEGNLALYRESGVATGKEWLTAQDDLVEEDCQENENEGPIGLDEDFPSGDASPPAHPNCRCTLLPVVEPLDDEGDVEATIRWFNLEKYSEDQPRDERGRFGSGGSSDIKAMSHDEFRDFARLELKDAGVKIGNSFKIDPSLREDVLHEVKQLGQQYPLDKPATIMTDTFKDEDKSYARFSQLTTPYIILSERFYGVDRSKLEESLSYSKTIGWSTSSDPRSVIAHEYGHAIGQTLLDRSLGDYRENVKSAIVEHFGSNGVGLSFGRDSFSRESYRGDKGLVSDYAKTNADEWFAESFAASRYGDSSAKGMTSVKAVAALAGQIKRR